MMADEAGLENSGLVPIVQNVVSTFNHGCRLNLKAIAMTAKNAEYNPKRFHAVIIRIREPRTTGVIFQTGKMICTEAKSDDDSKLAARKYARIIQKLGFPAKFTDFRILNVVCSCDVKFPVRLETMAYYDPFAQYEPEIFPGLLYRMKQPKVTILVFMSGKVVLTGAKSKALAFEAFGNIYPIVAQFRRKPRNPLD